MHNSFRLRAMFRKLTSLLCGLFGMFFFARATLGCECPAPSMQARSEQADTILIVEILGHRGHMRHAASTDVRVIKAYKGSVRVGEKFVLGDSADTREDTCRIWFASEARGGRWLIFAKSSEDVKNGRWLIRNCGRSAPVEFAKHDIDFLDKPDKYRGRTRVYGFAGPIKVTYASRSILGAVDRQPGRRVVFRGGGRELSVPVSPDGFFEVLDVPPGFYKATLASTKGVPYGYPYRAFYEPVSIVVGGINKYGPFNLTVGATDEERAAGSYDVHVPESGDAEINLRFDTSNWIKGRVFGPDGRPIPHAIVGLRTYSAVAVADQTVLADENGRYELTHHVPGIYVLGVNLRNSLRPDNPYATLYFPGIASRAHSKLIQIGADTVINDADFHIPAFRDLVTLSGRLVFADGSPVTGGFVRFFRDGNFQTEYDEVTASVKPDGRFRLRVVKGEHGRLFGGVTSVSEGVNGCVDKTQRMVDNDYQKGFKRLFSADKNLIATRNISGLVIKFIQTPCK